MVRASSAAGRQIGSLALSHPLSVQYGRSGIQMYDDKHINSLFSLKNCEGGYCMLEAFHASGWYLAAHREVRAMHAQGHRVWLRNGN